MQARGTINVCWVDGRLGRRRGGGRAGGTIVRLVYGGGGGGTDTLSRCDKSMVWQVVETGGR